MTLRHYAFGNIGRDKNPRKSSLKVDLDALRGLRDAVPDEKTALFLCEINEGDDNNEYNAIRQVFPKWKIYGRSTREPILLSPDQPKPRTRIVWVKDTAVERWSPRRSILLVHLSDEPTTLFGLHPAAGANGQGDRPRHAREPLQKSWTNTVQKRNMLKRANHRRGRNIVEMIDANAYDLRTLPLMPGEKVVVHDATDWGRVWPADDYRANFRKGKTVPFNIDSHDGLTMHGTFKRK